MYVGIAWTLLASIFLGTFALPAKYIKNYAWENTWGAFFFIGMLIVPIGFSSLALHGLWQTYGLVSGGIIFWVIALGFLWGCGFCCWGTGLSMVGLSLGYALTMGTMALMGSILPLFLGGAANVSAVGKAVIIAGILVCIAGVAINGLAGMKRERSQCADAATGGAAGKSMLAGVIICILAGLLSSGCNVAFHIGGTIGKIGSLSVSKYGNPEWLAGLSVWTLVFIGGLLSSFTYCSLLLCKNNTWKGFAVAGSGLNLFLVALMAIGHFACLFFYGLGGWMLGPLGTSVGFAIFQSGSLLVAAALGFMTGEWKQASAESKSWLARGLTVLILGIVIVSVGNTITIK